MLRKEFIEKTSPEMRRAIRNWLGGKVDSLADRAALAGEIEHKASGGKVAMVESGMDCDCVQYSGRIRMVQAIVSAYVHAVNRAYADAEGPISIYMATPAEARAIRYSSRDLAAEAHEDGHPGVVYP